MRWKCASCSATVDRPATSATVHCPQCQSPMQTVDDDCVAEAATIPITAEPVTAVLEANEEILDAIPEPEPGPQAEPVAVGGSQGVLSAESSGSAAERLADRAWQLLAGKRYKELPPLCDQITASQDRPTPEYENEKEMGLYFVQAGDFLSFSFAYSAFGAPVKRVIRLRHPGAEAWFIRGYCQCETEEFTPAAQSLEQSLRMFPWNPDALNELGHCYQKLGHTQEALDTFRKAVAVCRTWPFDLVNRYWITSHGVAPAPSWNLVAESRAWRGMGYQLVERKCLDEAERAFHKSLELEPDNSSALSELEYIRNLRQGDAKPGPDPPPYAVPVSQPAARPPAVFGDGRLSLILSAMERIIEELEGHRQIRAIFGDPVGQSLAVFADGGDVRIESIVQMKPADQECFLEILEQIFTAYVSENDQERPPEAEDVEKEVPRPEDRPGPDGRIGVFCPKCRREFRVAPKHVGRKANCKICKTGFTLLGPCEARDQLEDLLRHVDKTLDVMGGKMAVPVLIGGLLLLIVLWYFLGFLLGAGISVVLGFGAFAAVGIQMTKQQKRHLDTEYRQRIEELAAQANCSRADLADRIREDYSDLAGVW